MTNSLVYFELPGVTRRYVFLRFPPRRRSWWTLAEWEATARTKHRFPEWNCKLKFKKNCFVLNFWDKSSSFSWASSPKRFHLICLPAFIKANSKFTHFNYLVILNFYPKNKSVVIWLNTCQLHLDSCWTFYRPALKLREPLNICWLFQKLEDKTWFHSK